MMRSTRKLFSILFFLPVILISTSFTQKGNLKTKLNTDILAYKLKLGWFTLGSGNVTIEKQARYIQNRSHDNVVAHTETLGLGNWLSNLDDKYTAIIDSQTSKSYSAYKNVKTGKSTWEQWSSFNYDSMEVSVKVKDYRKENPDTTWNVKLTDITFDVLGTFLYYKNTDWSKVSKGDSLMIDTFYENKLYHVGVQYMGREKIDYNDNMVNTYRLHLILPHVENLKKDKPVIIWLSADKNHYPIRIQSKLFIGTARCELYTINDAQPAFTNL